MKKILILGNHEIVIYNFRKELVQRLIDEGHEVYLSFPYGEKVEYFKKIGCKYIETTLNRRNTNPIEDIKLLIKYIKIIRDIKPEVVLTYTVKPNVYGGIACRINKVPYICNVTGLGSSYINGGITQRIVKYLSKISFRKAQKVFFQNSSDMKIMKNQGVVINNNSLLPGSGVNLNQYKVLPHNSNNNTIKFSFIARIMKDKGIDEYLEVAKKIKYKYKNVEFDVIGMIDQLKYKDILNQYINEGTIKYHGFQQDMIPFIKNCDCIVNPSYAEGMSNVLLEGAASGRALIASDIPGCKEIVLDGINGYTFEVKNTEELYKSIEKFINLKYEEKVKMGLEGRRIVEEQFDRQIVVNAYIEEINNIAKKNIMEVSL